MLIACRAVDFSNAGVRLTGIIAADQVRGDTPGWVVRMPAG